MKKNTSLLLTALALSSLGASSARAQSTFSDVPDNHWAAAAVKRLAEAGIIEGLPAGQSRAANVQVPVAQAPVAQPPKSAAKTSIAKSALKKGVAKSPAKRAVKMAAKNSGSRTAGGRGAPSLKLTEGQNCDTTRRQVLGFKYLPPCCV